MQHDDEVRELHGRGEPVADGSGADPAGAGPVDGALPPLPRPGDRLTCGICTGGIRLYSGNLHGRPITDWKHTDVPPGTAPHRPVVGRMVDRETLDCIHRPAVPQETEKKPKAPPPKHVRTSPATPDMYVESQSITTMLKVADEEGWAVLDRAYRELDDGSEYLVFRFRRRDLAAVGIWKLTDTKGWLFDEGYTLSKLGYNRVASTSLKEWLKARDERCPDCGLSSSTHTEGECPA